MTKCVVFLQLVGLVVHHQHAVEVTAGRYRTCDHGLLTNILFHSAFRFVFEAWPLALKITVSETTVSATAADQIKLNGLRRKKAAMQLPVNHWHGPDHGAGAGDEVHAALRPEGCEAAAVALPLPSGIHGFAESGDEVEQVHEFE